MTVLYRGHLVQVLIHFLCFSLPFVFSLQILTRVQHFQKRLFRLHHFDIIPNSQILYFHVKHHDIRIILTLQEK